ncbi:MAG: Maf family nucleotide pyrophosphatase [Gammaproteobacteria bacterium]|nr:Maf family nucleotide pyrophosphatase [Gammaproteobacteria bacterium]
MPEQRLILASSSPFRRMLLERLGHPFDVISPDVDETPRPGEKPQALVERLARDKAQRVAQDHPEALVIGSDQVAQHGQRIVGKPHTRENAIAQLREASGKCVTLYTGLALVNATSGSVRSEVVPYTVCYRQLDDELITRYLEREQPYQCAGSLRAEGLGIALLESFQGDDPNALIGLPLIRLVRMLEAEGYPVV